MDDLGDQGDVTALLDRRSDTELAALMEGLGGNCVETMAETFAAIDHDRPTCFLAYTIKGWGTPIAGHKDNHGGLMTKAQMAGWQEHMGVPEGQEWEPLGALEDVAGLKAFLAGVPFSPMESDAMPARNCRSRRWSLRRTGKFPLRQPLARSSICWRRARVNWPVTS